MGPKNFFGAVQGPQKTKKRKNQYFWDLAFAHIGEKLQIVPTSPIWGGLTPLFFEGHIWLVTNTDCPRLGFGYEASRGTENAQCHERQLMVFELVGYNTQNRHLTL